MAEQVGKVYLVGSGPGDAAYLTLQAQNILAQAEVLVYDALVDGDLIDLVPNTCLKLDVGKRGGEPSTPQSEINRLIVEHCLQGKQVVRLKNGDPFIFGRAQSEIGALKQANCDFEVIPGLSSALVAPLMAGIPLTDPKLSSGFTVVTAHDPDALNWVSLSKQDTLVLLMGGRTLSEIVRRLRGHGRSPSTPISIIRYAGRPEQQIWEGTLNTILAKTTGQSLAPCVIVIGEVVKLRAYVGEQGRRQERRHQEPDQQVTPDLRGENRRARAEGRRPPVAVPTPEGVRTQKRRSARELAKDAAVSPADSPVSLPVPPSQPLPLAAKTILVTRAVSQSRQFTDLLETQGARVIEMPTLEIGPPSSWRDLDRAIAQIDDFDWLVLTSTNAVDYFFERLEVVTGERAFYSNIKIAVVGEKTAQRLARLGLQPDFIPPNFVADSLVANFPEPLGGLRVLFPRVESGGREILVKEFTSLGAKVKEVAAYESRCPSAIAPPALKALQTGQVDVVTFASSKTVKHFCQLLQQVDEQWQRWLEGVAVTSIGPQTSQACESLLGRVDVEAAEYTLDGLTRAIVEWVTTPIAQPVAQPEPVSEQLIAEPTTERIEPDLDEPTPPELAASLQLEPPVATENLPLPDNSAVAPVVSTDERLSPLPDQQTEGSAPVGSHAVDTAAVVMSEAKPTDTSATAEDTSAIAEIGSAAVEVFEVELVAESEATGHMETLQVELDSTLTELMTAEAELIAEIQAVVQTSDADLPET